MARQNDVIRIGKISAVDRERGCAEVVYSDRDNSVTAMLPMLASICIMPEPGDQVLVAHLSNGTEAGVILGRLYSDKNPPHASGKGLFHADLDRDGNAFVRAQGGAVELVCDNLIVSGDLTVRGSITPGGDAAEGA